jgi:hypothetical protein
MRSLLPPVLFFCLSIPFLAGGWERKDLATFKAREMYFPDGFSVIDAPHRGGKVIKKVTGGTSATIAGFLLVDGKRYYISDWSFDRLGEREPSWIVSDAAETAAPSLSNHRYDFSKPMAPEAIISFKESVNLVYVWPDEQSLDVEVIDLVLSVSGQPEATLLPKDRGGLIHVTLPAGASGLAEAYQKRERHDPVLGWAKILIEDGQLKKFSLKGDLFEGCRKWRVRQAGTVEVMLYDDETGRDLEWTLHPNKVNPLKHWNFRSATLEFDHVFDPVSGYTLVASTRWVRGPAGLELEGIALDEFVGQVQNAPANPPPATVREAPPGPFIDRLERQWYPPESQLLDFVWLDPGRIDWEYSTNGRFAPSDDGEDWAGFGPARHDYGKLTEEFSGEAGGDQ